MDQCVRVFWDSSSRDGLIYFSLGTYTSYLLNTAVLKMTITLIHTVYWAPRVFSQGLWGQTLCLVQLHFSVHLHKILIYRTNETFDSSSITYCYGVNEVWICPPQIQGCLWSLGCCLLLRGNQLCHSPAWVASCTVMSSTHKVFTRAEQKGGHVTLTSSPFLIKVASFEYFGIIRKSWVNTPPV